MSSGYGLNAALAYRVVSAIFHQPLLLRVIAGVARRSAALSSALSLVASADGVRQALAREAAFTHARYAPLLVDGPFLIGLLSGPAHAAKRQCLQGLLPTPEAIAQATVATLPAIDQGVQAQVKESGEFDLIEDYMMPLVWNGIRIAYGATAATALDQDRSLLEAARWLGAQLLIGEVAPAALRQRALRSAAIVDGAFDRAMSNANTNLSPAWEACTPDPIERRRDAIGLLWVGHPATTQAGALMLQELMSRPALYESLLAESKRPGNTPASPCWRTTLQSHVVELMRFRSPFPMLVRTVPREALYPLDDGGDAGAVATAKPGALLVLTIGALFDPGAQDKAPRKYDPTRKFHVCADRWLIFGAGPRHCIAQHQVVEILVTALAGLLSMTELPLRPVRNPWRRRTYDGPVIVKMPLRF